MSHVFDNCIVTHEDSELLLEYGYVDGSGEYRSYVRLSGELAYTPCCGVVVDICDYDGCKAVTIQYSGNIAVRLSHLESVCVDLGESIIEGTLLGYSRNGALDFYFLTTEPNDLTRKVVFATLCMYPHEPTLVLNGLVLFESAKVYADDVHYDSYLQELELSNNKGD